MSKDLGKSTSYAYYVAEGGTKTPQEYGEMLVNIDTVATRAEDAADSAAESATGALNSKNAAQTAATTATNKATEATTAATTATTKAAEASTSASTATSAKDTAVSASQTATTKAAEATTAAATATSAKDDAVSANTAAQSAKTAAQTAQTGAETAAASVQSSAAQIATNTEDISQLKSELNAEETRAKAEEERLEELFTAPTQEAVNNWLNDHPEATTTVQGASLTENKFTTNLKLKTIKDYVTPQMFGAVGDGSVDDTTAFQAAIDSGKPVCIPSGSIIRVNGSVTINNTATIFGYGPESKLRVYGSIVTDSDNSHILEMFGFTFECYKITGTALIINKGNSLIAKNAMSIHDMFFYFRNNVDSSLDSVIMSVKGIREAAIVNCVFKGDSSKHGTAILFEADSTHLTMNISISECNFYSIGTFIDLHNNLSNYIYLAGIRVTNCTMIAGTNGIKASYVDTFHIVDNMIDFVTNPIYVDSCGIGNIIGNYLQTKDGAQCIYIANNKSSQAECRFINVQRNFIWSTVSKSANGIVFDGVTGKITQSLIADNRATALNTMINLNNCQNCSVSRNICHNSNTFIDLNSDSTLIGIENNRIDASVSAFSKNLHPSCFVYNGNIYGSRQSHCTGAVTVTGDGATRSFTFNHRCFRTPRVFLQLHTDNTYAVESVSANDTQFTITFETPPANGVSFELFYLAEIYLY